MPGNVRIDSDRFTHDTIDGETVIVDTVEGRLTLPVGLGPPIWARRLRANGDQDLAAEEFVAAGSLGLTGHG